jgi:hypothetical protein
LPKVFIVIPPPPPQVPAVINELPFIVSFRVPPPPKVPPVCRKFPFMVIITVLDAFKEPPDILKLPVFFNRTVVPAPVDSKDPPLMESNPDVVILNTELAPFELMVPDDKRKPLSILAV